MHVTTGNCAIGTKAAWKLAFSDCWENISSMRVLSTLSNVTLVSESNRPDWKCGTTDGGSEPSDKISSRVGSETK
jgi:hypothetical protein